MSRLPRPGAELQGRRPVGGDPHADQPRLRHRVRGQPAAEAARRRRFGVAPGAERGASSVAVVRRGPSRRPGRRRSRSRRSAPPPAGAARAPAARRCGSPAARRRGAPAATRAARGGAAARPRARSAAAARPRAVCSSTRASSAWPPSRPTNSFSACVEPLAVEVRVQVVQARRQAAAHLPVGRRVLAARQRAPAVAQAEQRVELLDQLGGGRPPAHRADADRVAGGGLARDLEDRERDVEPAAQVDVAVGLGLAAHVAGRAQRLDQPVLEQQRAELGLGHLVVDVLGLRRPGRAGARSASAPACAGRPTCRRRAGGRRRRGRCRRPARAGARRGAGARRAARRTFGGPRADLARRRAARSRRRSSARSRTAARTARRRPARTSARRAARGGPRRPRPRARRPASPGRGGAAAARTGARARPCRAPAGPATRARRARTPGAARARRRPRCGPPAPARAACCSAAAAPPRARAPRRPSPAMIPVKRWIPRPSGFATPTSDSNSLVQLAAADQHRADLGQLAALAREAVGLGVEGDELGGRERQVRAWTAAASARGPDGATALARAPCTTVRDSCAAALVLIACWPARGLRRQRAARERPAPGGAGDADRRRSTPTACRSPPPPSARARSSWSSPTSRARRRP